MGYEILTRGGKGGLAKRREAKGYLMYVGQRRKRGQTEEENPRENPNRKLRRSDSMKDNLG